MCKRIRIVLIVLFLCVGVCIGVFLIYKMSTWHAVFLFSKKDLEWLAPYQNGDMVFYTSDTGTDTMIVSRRLYNSPELLGIHCFSIFYAEGEYINIIYHNGNRIDCKLIIVKESDDYVNLMIDFDKRFSAEELQVGDTSTVVVKGHVYDDAITINDGNSSITQETGTNCEYFIWSKSKGLLEYKYLNGEVYTLYKKTPCMKSE